MFCAHSSILLLIIYDTENSIYLGTVSIVTFRATTATLVVIIVVLLVILTVLVIYLVCKMKQHQTGNDMFAKPYTCTCTELASIYSFTKSSAYTCYYYWLYVLI